MNEEHTGLRHGRDHPSLDVLFQRYKVCMARVTARTEHGDLANGAAFHIGDGYLVTARHVIEDHELVAIEPESHASPRELTIADTLLPDEPTTGLAILKTDFSLQHYMEKVTIERGCDAQSRSTSFRSAAISMTGSGTKWCSAPCSRWAIPACRSPVILTHCQHWPNQCRDRPL